MEINCVVNYDKIRKGLLPSLKGPPYLDAFSKNFSNLCQSTLHRQSTIEKEGGGGREGGMLDRSVSSKYNAIIGMTRREPPRWSVL